MMLKFEPQIDEIDDNGWLWTYDTIESDEIKLFLANTKRTVVGVVNESVSFNLDIQLGVNFYTAPLWFEQIAQKILKSMNSRDNDLITERCFNFIVNKKQINRYYLIKLVEWFRLKSFYYTNSGISNCANLEKELEDINLLTDIIEDGSQFKTCMLAESTLAVNWFPSDHQSVNDCAVLDYGDNVFVFSNFLKPLMSQTAVSLISESAPTHDRCCHFTEKTAFCLASKNFPIWIGGFGCADAMRDMGLDVFDDVIDHSYQYEPTLVERCYWAFANNLELLTDLTYAHSQRVKHSGRLQRNFDQCVPLVTQFVDKQLRAMPAAPRKILQQIRKKYGTD